MARPSTHPKLAEFSQWIADLTKPAKNVDAFLPLSEEAYREAVQNLKIDRDFLSEAPKDLLYDWPYPPPAPPISFARENEMREALTQAYLSLFSRNTFFTDLESTLEKVQSEVAKLQESWADIDFLVSQRDKLQALADAFDIPQSLSKSSLNAAEVSQSVMDALLFLGQLVEKCQSAINEQSRTDLCAMRTRMETEFQQVISQHTELLSHWHLKYGFNRVRNDNGVISADGERLAILFFRLQETSKAVHFLLNFPSNDVVRSIVCDSNGSPLLDTFVSSATDVYRSLLCGEMLIAMQQFKELPKLIDDINVKSLKEVAVWIPQRSSTRGIESSWRDFSHGWLDAQRFCSVIEPWLQSSITGGRRYGIDGPFEWDGRLVRMSEVKDL